MSILHIAKYWSLAAACASVVAFSVASCDEGEHDYYYQAVNNTDQPVCLAYKVVNTTETLYDTLQPGETDTLSIRRNVTGDDVWDIETSAELYQFSALDVSLNDSLFIENSRLRSLWGTVAERGDQGVYTLNLSRSMFTLSNHNYWFWIDNNSSYDFHFTTTKIPVTIPAGSSFLYPLAYTGRSKYVTELYDTTSSTTRVTYFTLSNIYWTSGADTLYARNFNANLRSQWTFSPVSNADIYGTTDSVGTYRLVITNKSLE